MKKIDTNRIRQYRLNKSELSKLMRKAHYVFDASVLLNLYFYSESTRNDFINSVLFPLKDRLWMPSQVEYEFLKNREDVILKPVKSYKNLLSKEEGLSDGGHIENIDTEINNIVDSTLRRIKNQVQTLSEKTMNDDVHPYIEQSIISDFSEDIKWFEKQTRLFSKKLIKLKNNLNKQVRIQKLGIETSVKKDKLLELILPIFNVGDSYPYEKLLEIAKIGKERYQLEIPPGYADDELKIGLQKYGDLIIWHQIIDYAKDTNNSIILITNDAKEDWWTIKNKERIAPRFELIDEFNSKVGLDFWMLSLKDFIHYAKQNLKLGIGNEAIDEVSTQQQFESISLKQQREARERKTEEWLELLKEAVENGEDIKANHEYFYKGKPIGTWLSLLFQRNKEGKKLDIRDKVIAAGFDNTKRGRDPEIVARRFINKLTDAVNPDKGEFQRHFNSTMMPKAKVLKKETIKEVNELWRLRFDEERIWEKKSHIKDKIEEWKNYRYDAELNPDGNWTPIQRLDKNLYKWVWMRKKDPKLLMEFKDRFTESEKEQMRKEGILI